MRAGGTISKFVLCLLLWTTSSCEARSLKALCRSVVARAAVFLEPKIPNQHLDVTLTDGGAASFHLGRQLNFGADATAYILENPKDFGVESVAPVVARVPHQFAILPAPILKLKSRAAPQGDAYDFLLSQGPTIRSSPYYPSSPAWAPNALPVVPILKKIDTTRGQIAIKPLVKGMELAEIQAKYPDGLPPEMIESLRDIYSFASAVRDQVSIPPALQKGPLDELSYNLDIVGRNLIWVKIEENPELAQALGLKRDTFLCFEPDYAKGNTDNLQAKPFADYLNEFTRQTTPQYLPSLIPRLGARR